jgi:hypothetical protein
MQGRSRLIQNPLGQFKRIWNSIQVIEFICINNSTLYVSEPRSWDSERNPESSKEHWMACTQVTQEMADSNLACRASFTLKAQNTIRCQHLDLLYVYNDFSQKRIPICGFDRRNRETRHWKHNWLLPKFSPKYFHCGERRGEKGIDQIRFWVSSWLQTLWSVTRNGVHFRFRARTGLFFQDTQVIFIARAKFTLSTWCIQFPCELFYWSLVLVFSLNTIFAWLTTSYPAFLGATIPSSCCCA